MRGLETIWNESKWRRRWRRHRATLAKSRLLSKEKQNEKWMNIEQARQQKHRSSNVTQQIKLMDEQRAFKVRLQFGGSHVAPVLFASDI